MRRVRIALLQMRVEDGDPDSNISRMLPYTETAGRAEADLLVLPELWSIGYMGVEEHAEPLESCTPCRIMAEVAEEHGMYVAGTVPLREKDGIRNSLLLYSPTGDLVARYDKIHLFPLFQEHHVFKPGSSPVVVDTRIGRIGFMICFDQRFPELARKLGLMGAELVLLPSAWGKPRLEQWRFTLRSRAAENQYFVAAVNRWGPCKTIPVEFAGHSAVADPWGDTVVEAGFGEILLLADIDIDEVAKARRKLPLHRLRREDVYRLE